MNQPFLWIHGTKDDFLDYATHGKTVYDQYLGGCKTHLRVGGAGHSDIEEIAGFDAYLQQLNTFITH